MESQMAALGVDRLKPEDQLRLVDEILNGFEEGLPPGLSEPQMRELDRRLALLESGGTTESTWEDVEARILARLRG
jgi:putative addiction module component (TIGR02574 family)